ncbi:50S ribosomal protein L21e [Candidatus Woesearchaeota archaeon]|nr:50S ribosomal protein L21e [Candidatus Woesearchaeota archaeon]
MQHIGGFRRKTRHKFMKSRQTKGKVSLRNYLQKLSPNDGVQLVVEPAVQKGMYFPRFHGLTGRVVGQQGSCYKVTISDKGAKKTIIVHPVHLKKLHVGAHAENGA